MSSGFHGARVLSICNYIFFPMEKKKQILFLYLQELAWMICNFLLAGSLGSFAFLNTDADQPCLSSLLSLISCEVLLYLITLTRVVMQPGDPPPWWVTDNKLKLLRSKTHFFICHKSKHSKMVWQHALWFGVWRKTALCIHTFRSNHKWLNYILSFCLTFFFLDNSDSWRNLSKKS